MVDSISRRRSSGWRYTATSTWFPLLLCMVGSRPAPEKKGWASFLLAPTRYTGGKCVPGHFHEEKTYLDKEKTSERSEHCHLSGMNTRLLSGGRGRVGNRTPYGCTSIFSWTIAVLLAWTDRSTYVHGLQTSKERHESRRMVLTGEDQTQNAMWPMPSRTNPSLRL